MLLDVSTRSGASGTAVGGPGGPVGVAAVNVVVGEEEFLVERAVNALVSAARARLAGAAAGDGPGGDGPGGDGLGGGAAGGGGLGGGAAGGGDLAGASGDVHDVPAAELAAGELASLTSPSLFGGGGVVVIRSVQDAGKEVADEIVRYAAAPEPDVVLVITHAGGAKGKALLTSLTGGASGKSAVGRGAGGKGAAGQTASGKAPAGKAAAGAGAGTGAASRPGAGPAGQAAVIECPKITRFADRLDFVRAEFRRAGRPADEGGLRSLLDAVGSGLREIAAACSQLAADVDGPIDAAAVARYYQGRAEASGFTVSDRAVEGRLGDALEQLRWALATGVPPVLITSALAQGIRLLGRVGAAPRGLASAALAADVGAPPWKIDRVRQQLRGWAPEGVARALQVVAEADAQIKGEAASADYALERAIRRIVACRN
jgi:DNA polymerase III subunit delta